MSQGSVLFGIAAVAVAATVTIYVAITPPPADMAVLIDTSVSVDRNCGGLKGLAMTTMANTSRFRKGSSLSILAMGTSALNTQPRLQWSGPIPYGAGVVFGQDAERDKQVQGQFEAEIGNACTSAEPGTHSPIFEMARQGIAHLRSGANGCKGEDACILLIKTDLEDDVHAVLKVEIAKIRKGQAANLPAELHGVLDNRGIRVQFCGLSELAKRSGKSPAVASQEELKRLWLPLFSDPGVVSFQPYCR